MKINPLNAVDISKFDTLAVPCRCPGMTERLATGTECPWCRGTGFAFVLVCEVLETLRDHAYKQIELGWGLEPDEDLRT